MSKFTDFKNRLSSTPESDECYTPERAVEPLFRFLNKNSTFYEAASEHSSSIINGLEAGGFKVVGSQGKDFFECKSEDVYDSIITNPPYSIKDKFIDHCYQLGVPFALLLPVTAIQGQRRGKWFQEKGISLLVHNKRIDFTGGGSPHSGNAWFMGNGFCESNRIWFV